MQAHSPPAFAEASRLRSRASPDLNKLCTNFDRPGIAIGDVGTAGANASEAAFGRHSLLATAAELVEGFRALFKT